MLKRSVVLLGLIALVACGGGSPSSPTPAPTPVPTPTPPVSYAGTFGSDTLTYTDETGVYLASATLKIVESGNTLVFGSLALTTPFVANYPLGSAPHTNGRFEGNGGYDSRGCGRATTHFEGYFSADGRILNLTMKFTFTGCGDTDIRGELRR